MMMSEKNILTAKGVFVAACNCTAILPPPRKKSREMPPHMFLDCRPERLIHSSPSWLRDWSWLRAGIWVEC